MKKMQLLLIFSIPFVFSGCCSIWCNNTVECPQDDIYRPTFDTTLFPTVDTFQYKYWVQNIDSNESLIIMKPDDFYKNMEKVGVLRNDHNLLINKINEFNLKIEELNKKQNKEK